MSRFRDASVVAAENQLSTQLGDEVVILGLRDSVYYGLADVGTRVWQLIQSPRRFEEIVDDVVAEYDVTPETAVADLDKLLTELEAQGLVVIVPAERSQR